VRIGIHYANFTHPDWQTRLTERLTETARVADQGGASMFTVMDHYFQMEVLGGPPEPMLEGYTTLGYLAGRTEQVRLSLLVTGTTYRRPGLLAKILTTLDVLSGGRAMLGIGAGDYVEEAEGLGLPFPPSLPERFDVLEETVQACLAMWEGESGSGQPFEGRHVRLGRALNIPQSLSRPHPPLLIAGGGEQRTLPLVARYGDACNIPPSPDIPRKLDLLRSLTEREGRDYDAIEKTAPFRFDVSDAGKVGELIGQLRWLGEMGIDTVFGYVLGAERITPLEIMGRDVIPVVREVGRR
jgi:F420-dependent oxidoreductase-like protein